MTAEQPQHRMRRAAGRTGVNKSGRPVRVIMKQGEGEGGSWHCQRRGQEHWHAQQHLEEDIVSRIMMVAQVATELAEVAQVTALEVPEAPCSSGDTVVAGQAV